MKSPGGESPIGPEFDIGPGEDHIFCLRGTHKMIVDQMFRPIAVALAGLALLGAAPKASEPGVGQAARPFTVTTFAKQKVRLADLRGKVVVINYWATWCAPCKSE